LTITGEIEAIDCILEGMLVRIARTEGFVQRVRLLSSTQFFYLSDQRVRCGFLRAGDVVRVDGVLRINQPRALNAARVTVTRPRTNP